MHTLRGSIRNQNENLRTSLRKNTIRMQTPGKSSRKHGQDANPRKVSEKTRSGSLPGESSRKHGTCKPQETLRENTVRMQTTAKSSKKHGQDANPRKISQKTPSGCKPQESLRENTVRMQTSGESSREHGPDANPRKDFEKTRPGCKPMTFPQTASLFFQTYPGILPVFSHVFWDMEAQPSKLYP